MVGICSGEDFGIRRTIVGSESRGIVAGTLIRSRVENRGILVTRKCVPEGASKYVHCQHHSFERMGVDYVHTLRLFVYMWY